MSRNNVHSVSCVGAYPTVTPSDLSIKRYAYINERVNTTYKDIIKKDKSVEINKCIQIKPKHGRNIF